MRGTAFLLVVAGSLALTGSATAALQPVVRSRDGHAVPLVRAGTLRPPAGEASGRTRVIVTLALPPLAEAYGDTFAFASGARRLDTTSRVSRAYLARVDAAQRAAVAELRRAIPEARVSWRYRILLDGFTVSLPAARLPQLVRLGFVRKVYPSLRYTEHLNQSPSVIGASQLRAQTGADGSGVKIGIVDDGIDQTNPFFNPAGYSYPSGFPKGDTAFTTPKVIVARAFPGPGSGAGGKLPLDRHASFHGTHVAGIAAGDAGTSAPAGPDHPAVAGLSGVAPRAQLGNYRVFNVPLPFLNEDSAETPEIVKAFEAAVADGMDVINFSGGGPETDPATDAMVPTIENVVRAGVVPVISAGNDRDDFGLGTVGSPGTASDAITVAAVSNTHFFGQELTVSSPQLSGLTTLPFRPARSGIAKSWTTTDQTLVDITAVTGKNGKPVDRLLCGSPSSPSGSSTPLAPGSLEGKVALVWRGTCSFTSKADRIRAAGGVGMVLVDNRSGDPNPIPVDLSLPAGTISDLDGERLHEAMASTGGLARFRIVAGPNEVTTNRSDIPTSFSAGGPTDFQHLLKPDISAPGGQILSATLPEFARESFAVFDGTSMSAPHISGAVALLLERHPGWSPDQVKSALMATAAPTYADTARTREAPVLLEGAGLASLTAADDPQILTSPQSLSFTDLNVNAGAASKQLTVSVSDAGGGAGTWTVAVAPQQATPGATVTVQPSISLAPGGTAIVPVTASASPDAAPGDDYGFVLLTRGATTRRLPYFFSVTRPGLAAEKATTLRTLQAGSTAQGENRVTAYRWPSAPFGPGPLYEGQPGVDETGAEHVYAVTVKQQAINVGVTVVAQSANTEIDPWFLGARDENAVQGYTGTPVNVNGLMLDYRFPNETAGAVFVKPGTYYVVVDSPRNPATGRPASGGYVLRSWVNDVKPPRVALVTTRVAAGRPTIVARAVDDKSGVDPLSLVLAYGTTLVGASAYDAASGTVVFALPAPARKLKLGTQSLVVAASDLQESKNVNTIGANVMPNTTFARKRLSVVKGPVLTWLAPAAGRCVPRRAGLVVVASDTHAIASVAFYDGKRRIARVERGVAGLYATTWSSSKLPHGRHTLRAVVADKAGKQATSTRVVRVCR